MEKPAPPNVIEDLFEGSPHQASLLMPCEPDTRYNLIRTAPDRYRLSLAAPGLDKDDIRVLADGRCLSITGALRMPEVGGDVLHAGLDRSLDRTFLMVHPLDVTSFLVHRGLLEIQLREQPRAGVSSNLPPRLVMREGIALAA